MKSISNIQFGILTLVLSLSACQTEQVEVSIDKQVIHLKASMESQSFTKVQMNKSDDGRYYPFWEGADSLAVFTEEGQRPAGFTLVEGAGTTEGLFEGARQGERYVALYPFDDGVQWVDGQLLFNLPQKQSHSSPMVAVSDDGYLRFKNLCSIIKVSLTGTCVVGSIKLQSESNYLSGPASVSLPFSDYPILSMSEGGSHEVVLDCGAVLLNKDNPKEFYISVPPGSYDGFTISVDAYTVAYTKSISQQVVLKRAELRPVTPFMVEAPMIDLDNLPATQIWYKTKSGRMHTFSGVEELPFDVGIKSHTYDGGFGLIILDSPLKQLMSHSFRSEDIIELHLPNSVETIEIDALPYHLTSFHVPDGLTSLGRGNLSGIDSLYGSLVPDEGHSIVSKGKLLGVLDKGIGNYEVPQDVKSIGPYSFSGTSFKRITVSEGVSIISQDAFSYSSVEEIILPETIQKVGPQNAINGIRGFYGSAHCISQDHRCLISPKEYSGTAPELAYIIPDPDADEYSIPEGITTLSTSFGNWPNLKRVYFPETLVDFKYGGAFSECPKIEKLEGPNVTLDGHCIIKNGVLMGMLAKGSKKYTIPSGVYSLCADFMCLVSRPQDTEELTISEGVETLGYYCFEFSSLKSIILPTTIKEIGEFVLSGVSQIRSVYLPVRVPPTVLGKPSWDKLPELKVYVPDVSYSDYMSDPAWSGTYGEYLKPYHFDVIDPPAPYESVDYSQDGRVTVLQEATDGKGIDLVLMGDAFSDRMIRDGSYLSAMEWIKNAYFAIEPFRSFQHLFNVYVVNVVSASEDYKSGNTALNTEIMVDGSVLSNLDKGVEYALKAIPDERMDEATIIMVCNTPGRDLYGQVGTCRMARRESTPTTDYGSGLGFACFSTPWERALVQHEAGGHGFAKLADEYSTRSQGNENVFSEEFKADLDAQHYAGWSMNIDYNADPQKVLWTRFLSDTRYEKEALGIYEGAGMFFTKGLYRPSEDSMMNNNSPIGFNAPSREAIYYRIHKLAYGDEWRYDFEEFVKWDQGSHSIRPTSTKAVVAKNYEVRDPLPVTKSNPDEWTVTVMK